MPHNLRNKDVFINCPFDDPYKPDFHAILFAVSDLGFSPAVPLKGPVLHHAHGPRIDRQFAPTRTILEGPIGLVERFPGEEGRLVQFPLQGLTECGAFGRETRGGNTSDTPRSRGPAPEWGSVARRY